MKNFIIKYRSTFLMFVLMVSINILVLVAVNYVTRCNKCYEDLSNCASQGVVIKNTDGEVTTFNFTRDNLNTIYPLINEYRVENGLQPMNISIQLENSSDVKAEDMVNRKYWSHYKDNKQADVWDTFTESGYYYYQAGENLAEGFADVKGVVEGWKKSPTHNDILLGKDFTDMGIGAKCTLNFIDSQPTCIVVLHVANKGVENGK